MLNIDQLKYDFKKSKEEYFLSIIDGLESNSLADHKMIHWCKDDMVYFTQDDRYKIMYVEPDTFHYYIKTYGMSTLETEDFLMHLLCKHCFINNQYIVNQL